MVKGWKRNPKEGQSNKPIEQRDKVEYAWREKDGEPGDYLSVVKDKSMGNDYIINFSVSGSQNQRMIGTPYSNKDKAYRDAVRVARMRNKGATVDELDQRFTR